MVKNDRFSRFHFQLMSFATVVSEIQCERIEIYSVEGRRPKLENLFDVNKVPSKKMVKAIQSVSYGSC